tara:strand:- start:11410 stop:12660 length:1251 start_codon:yes stop_codon:yes gene_type:complete
MHAIILGTGWSGLAAAITLIQNNVKPILLEASPHAGGRAREVIWNDLKIDNGQHLLLGAYTSFIELLEIINPKNFDINSVLHRMPFELNFYDQRKNLVSISRKNNFYYQTKGLSFKEKILTLNLIKNIYLNKYLNNNSVNDFLIKSKQNTKLYNLWNNICVSALTTNIHSAHAETFANTLKSSIFKNKIFSDLLIPKVSLSELFVKPAVKYIINNGGEIHYNTRAKKIITNSKNNIITNIETNKGNYSSEKIISALPYFVTNKLFNNININLDSEKITTLYLKYKNNPKLPHLITGLLQHNIDFIFDKKIEHPGLISVVSSSNNNFNNLPKDKMLEIAYNEIKNLFPEFNEIDSYKIITEKFAAYRCDYNSKKIDFKKINPYKNLCIAGDYNYHKYPATLESAIRSGIIGAKSIAP